MFSFWWSSRVDLALSLSFLLTHSVARQCATKSVPPAAPRPPPWLQQQQLLLNFNQTHHSSTHTTKQTTASLPLRTQ
jgi:hypothetical protein